MTLKAEEEVLNGDVTCDNISSVTVILENGTTLKGAINADSTAGSMALTLDSTSTWDVTGSS